MKETADTLSNLISSLSRASNYLAELKALYGPSLWSKSPPGKAYEEILTAQELTMDLLQAILKERRG